MFYKSKSIYLKKCRVYVLLIVLSLNSICIASGKRQLRRFMWRDTENTMDDIVSSVASGAQVMKDMLSGLMPTTVSTVSTRLANSGLDFLPSETTRIRYIIKKPTSKPIIRVVKIKVPKKHVKIITLPKPIVVGKHPKMSSHFPTLDMLRKLEKEQEMIAEGRMPIKSGNEVLESIQKEKLTQEQSQEDETEIIKGKVNKYGNDWRPVYHHKDKHPTSYINMKTSLNDNERHNDFDIEPLPIPAKQTFEPCDIDSSDHDAIDADLEGESRHSYEVTENAAEETIAMPFTQEMHSVKGFVPSSGMQRTKFIRSNIATSTTTTTEPPNYPISFLKRQRDRPSSHAHFEKFKMSEAIWPPTKGSHNNNTHYLHGQAFATTKSTTQQPFKMRIKNEKWSISGPTLYPAVTDTVVAEAGIPQRLETTAGTQIQKQTRQRMRPKPTARAENGEHYRLKDIRQRGSIKFSDQLHTEIF